MSPAQQNGMGEWNSAPHRTRCIRQASACVRVWLYLIIKINRLFFFGSLLSWPMKCLSENVIIIPYHLIESSVSRNTQFTQFNRIMRCVISWRGSIDYRQALFEIGSHRRKHTARLDWILWGTFFCLCSPRHKKQQHKYCWTVYYIARATERKIHYCCPMRMRDSALIH